MEANVLNQALTIPEASISNTGGASSFVSFSSGMQLRLTTVGENASVCKDLLGFTFTGLAKGSFIAGATASSNLDSKSSAIYCNTGTYQPYLSPSSAATSVSDTAVQHTWTCKDCVFSAQSKVEIVMDYSCQINVIEVAAVRADGTISVVRTSTADDVSTYMDTINTKMTLNEAEATLITDKGPITGIDWEVATHFTTLENTLTGVSYKGYSVVNMSSRISRTPLTSGLDPSLASLLPVTRAITLRITLPLQPFYSSVIWLEKTSTIQLVSSIIGLASIFTIFQMVFSHVEHRFFKDISMNNKDHTSTNDDNMTMNNNNQLKIKKKLTSSISNDNRDNYEKEEKMFLPPNNISISQTTINGSYMSQPSSQVHFQQRLMYPPEQIQNNNNYQRNTTNNSNNIQTNNNYQVPQPTIIPEKSNISIVSVPNQKANIIINPLVATNRDTANTGNTSSLVASAGNSLVPVVDTVNANRNIVIDNGSSTVVLPPSSMIPTVTQNEQVVNNLDMKYTETQENIVAYNNNPILPKVDTVSSNIPIVSIISNIPQSSLQLPSLPTLDTNQHIPETIQNNIPNHSSTSIDNSNHWKRFEDEEGDVWYVSERTGESVWELPSGAILV